MIEPRFVLSNLVPGRNYLLQVRSKNGDQVSPWSGTYPFTAAVDGIAPEPPKNLNLIVEGSSFVLRWDSPEVNEDGSPLNNDLKYYELTVSNGSAEYVYKIQDSNEFEFTLTMNKAVFGSASASLTFSIKSVDWVGNKSAPAVALIEDAPPPPITNIVVTGNYGGISVTWDALNITDLLEYRVYASKTDPSVPTDERPAWSGNATAAFIDSFTAEPVYIRVVALDVFEQRSTSDVFSAIAADPTSVDVVPPAAVTNATATSTSDGKYLTVNLDWTNPSDVDLDSYLIRYSTSTSGPWTTERRQYSTSTPKATLTGLPVGAPGAAGSFVFYSYYIQIKSVDTYGNQATTWTNVSPYPIAANGGPAPRNVENLEAYGGITTLTVVWKATDYFDNDFGNRKFTVDIAKTSNFSPIIQSKVVAGSIVSFSNLDVNTIYHVRVTPQNFANVSGTPSTAVTGTGTAGGEFSGGLPAELIKFGVMHGDRIAVNTLDGDAIVANTLSADRLQSNTSFTNNLFVKSILTVDTLGRIKSSNYNASTQQGWELDQTGFRLYSGSIASKLIEVQESSQNLMHPAFSDFEFSPSFYSTIKATRCTAIASTSIKRFGNAALQINTTGANSFFYFSNSDGMGKVPTDGSTAYIMSAWVYNSGASTTTVRIGITHANGSTNGANTVLPPNQWTRVQWAFTTPSNVIEVDPFVVIVESPRTLFFDGIQIERQIGGLQEASQWTPPGFTSIDGSAIRTGTIQSNSTINIGGVLYPTWSINMAGNMQINSASVRGTIVIGQAGDTNAQISNMSIASRDYLSGSRGWAIKGDGSAEFQNGTFRGNIIATSGTFSGNITSSATITGGTLRSGAIITTRAQDGKITFQADNTGTYVEGDVRATLFRSTGATYLAGARTYNSYLELGATGDVDPVDELRFFVGGYVGSVRSPRTSPGSVLISTGDLNSVNLFSFNRLGLDIGGRAKVEEVHGKTVLRLFADSGNGAGLELYNASGNHPTLSSRYGPTFGAKMKFLNGQDVIQSRTQTDGGYGVFQAREFSIISDKKSKDSVERIDVKEISKDMQFFKPSSYELKYRPNQKEMGFIAQDLPEKYTSNYDGELAIKSYPVLMLLAAAIQDLDRRLSEREAYDPPVQV